MPAEDFPEEPPRRALWLTTLADLALLLVGFFVLLEANRTLDARAIGAGLAERLGVEMPVAPAMAVDARVVAGFASGAAAPPALPPATLAWARSALADPRIALRVAGTTDGSAADVDPANRAATLLAADRARAVAAALAATGVPTRRIAIATAEPGAEPGRHVTLTLAFTGEKEASRP